MYLGRDTDVAVLATAVRTLRGTAGDALDLMLVDDHSPRRKAVDAIADMAGRWDFELVRKPENTGFSSTVNVGLYRALSEGRDAILINADIEFREPGWLEAMLATPNIGRPGKAWVVGALLSFPNGLIQHGGTYYSLLTRNFDHLWKFAPETIADAHVPRVCPVTGALQLIRNEALDAIGIYDEEFRMAFEDVDYCLRVFDYGEQCVYNPLVRAWHHESLFRGAGTTNPKVREWTSAGFRLLTERIAGKNMARFVPTW